jgi:hypothetical protein
MTDEKKIEEQSTQRVSRRNVLKAAVAAGGAAALGFPAIVKAQGVTTMPGPRRISFTSSPSTTPRKSTR